MRFDPATAVRVIGSPRPLTRPGPPADEPTTLTAAAQRALRQAGREAKALGHPYVGTEHLFLALLAEGNSTSAGLYLKRSGLTYSGVRAQIHKALCVNLDCDCGKHGPIEAEG